MRQGVILALCAAALAASAVETHAAPAKAKHIQHKQDDEPVFDENGDWDASSEGDVDVSQGSLAGDESIDISGDVVDFSFDGSGSDSVDWSSSVTGSEELDASMDLSDASMDIDVNDSEDLSEDLDLDQDEELDELIKLPKDAESVRLRVRDGNVELEILRAQKPKESVKKHQEHVQPHANHAVEESVVKSSESWLQKNAGSPAFIAAAVGAIAAVLGLVGIVVANRRNAEFERSVLALEAAEEEQATGEKSQDGPAHEADESEEAEDQESSVVEGSV